MEVTTSQFKTLLIRKLGNLLPGYDLEFPVSSEKGLKFQLKDSKGAYRSNVVTIHRYSSDTLEKESLFRAIVNAGKPEAGFPKGVPYGT